MGVFLILTGILFLTGSINWFGQWLIETVPALGQIESWVTPHSLEEELRRHAPGN
jgi:cytochrome c-type biogenesis protein